MLASGLDSVEEIVTARHQCRPAILLTTPMSPPDLSTINCANTVYKIDSTLNVWLNWHNRHNQRLLSVDNSVYKSQNQQTNWREDADGFLRCTTTVLKSCVMAYNISELDNSNIPAHLLGNDVIYLYVPPEEIASPESVSSLQGKPVNVGHEWQAAGSTSSVGNVAGDATYEPIGGLLYSDTLITDPATIARIKSNDGMNKLTDQSAGYRNKIDWTSGTAPDGQHYDGIQRDIRYNHVALLPQGCGRAGQDVRIINNKGGAKVSDFTNIKFGKTVIRVMNEDTEKMQDAIDSKADDSSKERNGKLDELSSQVDDLNSKLGDLTSQRDDLLGQVNALKEQLETSTSDAVQDQAVDEAISDQSDADDILNAADVDNKKEVMTENGKRIYGHALRVKVINAVKTMNSKELLTDAQSENKDMVKGMFSIMKENMLSKKTTINGAGVIKSLNEGKDEKQLLSSLNTEQRKNKLWGVK